MPRLSIPVLAGVIWVSASGLAAGPEAPKKPQTQPAAAAKPAAEGAGAPATQPSVPVHPIRTQTTFVVDPSQITTSGDLAGKVGPITVTLNYFDRLPGLDLDKLSPQRRQRVLDRANKEACSCGCKGDTIARCLVNDPSCKLVKSLAAQIYEEERLRPEVPR